MDHKERKKLLANFELIDNILCLKQDGLHRAVVPFQFRRQLLTVYHNDKKAGHKGHEQTLLLIAKTYWWPGLTQDVKNFVQACVWCGVAKTRKIGKGLAIGWGLEPRKLQCVHADYYGPLTTSTKGNRYVFLVVDRFTTWSIMIQLPLVQL